MKVSSVAHIYLVGHSIFITAQDGLRLHVREYGPRTAAVLPVVCLRAWREPSPTLTRWRRHWRTARRRDG